MPRDVKADLLAFLRTHVDTANLSVEFDETDINYADYDGGLEYPGIYLQAENTVVPGGGTTGYTGMDAGGAGPTQDPVTTVQVDCWGGTTQTDRLQEADVHPDGFANELQEAVWGVCFDNAQGPNGYRFVSVSEPTEANDTDVSPVAYRRIVPVAMGYHFHPRTE